MFERWEAGVPNSYCHFVASKERARGMRASRSVVLPLAQYFWIGAQKSAPRPSIYAFPFCEMIAWMLAGFRRARRNATGAP